MKAFELLLLLSFICYCFEFQVNKDIRKLNENGLDDSDETTDDDFDSDSNSDENISDSVLDNSDKVAALDNSDSDGVISDSTLDKSDSADESSSNQ